eukprot:GHVR01044412.1.p1 GENE.GHVR01044412.1~~GHVR01044412.1.p1  ORF type:complete len:130 (+),score=5.09 GHVR01044412.1:1657-2046(+)
MIKNSSNQTFANMLINEHYIFQIERAKAMFFETKNQGITYVLDHLVKITPEQYNRLNRNYESYNKKFEEQLQIYSEEPSQVTINILINKIKSKAEEDKKEKSNPKYNLIALIFSLWTIIKSNTNEEDIV